MDVSSWLQSLGLAQYAEAFAANHIDGAALRKLGNDDLRELGVASLGHRKRLLEAIGLLGTQDPVASAPAAAERRQVVVLFADLCNFTELSAEAGAEETHRIVERFLGRVDEILAEHGGTVDKHIGDATMALFGAPLSHEDDPLRAVTAADALQRAMPELSAALGRPLFAHVGIAMGDVVAGEIGGSVRRDYTVMGDTVNLAARLVGEAGPGETVLSEPVWRAVSSRMQATALGERPLKGVARAQRLWRLDGPRTGGPVGRLPFLGREVELAQAAAVLATAQPGAVLHLRGEAGIGKSRLLAEILADAARRGFEPVLVHILDFGAARRQSPLRLLAERLAALHAGWATDPAIDPAARAALHDVLERAMPADLAVPYAAMEDSRRAALRAAAVADLAAVVAARQPLAVAIEDLHWASDTMRALVRALARRTADARLLLLSTSRPEGDPVDGAFRRDSAGAHVAVIELGQLGADAMVRLAQAAASALDQAKVARFVARSGGNPLFLEQLALSAGEAEAAPLPMTIRGLVQARLDRLPPVDRAALQAAAVLGQRFSLAALRHVAGVPAYDPRPAIEAGLVGSDGDLLMFAHALIQEATYASLLGETVRGLHRRAADWFGENEPDLRARHLDRAGDARAAEAYLLAAERLRSSGRLAPALERAERGLELALKPGPGPGPGPTGDETVAVSLLLLAGHLKLDLGAAPEAQQRFATALARATEDALRGEAEFGIAAARRIVDDLDGAAEALDRAQAVAEAHGLVALESRCRHLRGNLLFPRGAVEECTREHNAALALAERAQSPELVARALGGLADAFYAQGRMRSARAALERCFEAARQAGAGAVEIANRPMAALADCCLLQLEAMRETAEQARVMARQAQSRRAELIALHGLMVAAIESNRPDEGLPHVVRAREIVAELGAWRFEGENVIFGAELEAAAGRPALAADLAREAVELCRRHALAYVGPVAFGIGASLTDDPAERDAWLAEGEALLQRPTLGHNHLFFRRSAIDTSLAAGRGDEARRHAGALAAFAAGEPLPFTDLICRRGRLLADAGEGRLSAERRAELSELAGLAERAGYLRLALPMRAAL